jgi:uncharacterized membrane protein YtjA (UPF0391 family)
MRSWSLVLTLIGVVAAVLGCGGIAVGAESMARVFFFIVVIALVASLFRQFVWGRRSPPSG